MSWHDEMGEIRKMAAELSRRLETFGGDHGAEPQLDPADFLLPDEAARLAKKSTRTIRRWVREYDIGWPCGSGSVLVSRQRLLAHLRGTSSFC